MPKSEWKAAQEFSLKIVDLAEQGPYKRTTVMVGCMMLLVSLLEQVVEDNPDLPGVGPKRLAQTLRAALQGFDDSVQKAQKGDILQ